MLSHISLRLPLCSTKLMTLTSIRKPLIGDLPSLEFFYLVWWDQGTVMHEYSIFILIPRSLLLSCYDNHHFLRGQILVEIPLLELHLPFAGTARLTIST